jgi:hypothetical protein
MNILNGKGNVPTPKARSLRTLHLVVPVQHYS